MRPLGMLTMRLMSWPLPWMLTTVPFEVGVGEGGGDGVEGGVAVGSVDVCVEGGF
jgi:hypothetical protein